MIKTLYHRQDPDTSREAAEKIVKSGALSRQEEEVWEAIIMYLETKPRTHQLLEWLDFTTKDIALQMAKGLHAYFKCYDICRKRFSGLHNKGKIERTGEKRDNCMVWGLK